MEDDDEIRQKVLRNTLEELKETPCDTQDYADVCVICLDSISERAVAIPCKHGSFDFLCLVSWLEERPTCPLCKTEVRSVEYEWKSYNDFKVYSITPNVQQRASNTGASSTRLSNASLTYRGRARTSRAPGPRRQAPVSPDATLLRRKYIYRNQLYSLHVGSNRLSRFQELTPQLFNRDLDIVSRARKWIRRELQVFEFLGPDASDPEGTTRRANNAEFLLEYIIAILKTVDIKGSGGQAEDMLQEFLGRDITRLFLHELRAWLRSPYTSLEDWDRNVQYSEDFQMGLKPRQARSNTSQDYGRTLEYQMLGPSTRSKVSNRQGRHDRGGRFVPYQSKIKQSYSQQILSDPG
ncbi:E3 ubiquitin-protein ligase Topors, partial [Lecanoromycetidae sp. Uapishka_2]